MSVNHLRPSSMADSDKTATPSSTPSVFEKGAVEMTMPASNIPPQVTEPMTGAHEKEAAVDVQRDSASKRNSVDLRSAEEVEEDDFEYPTKWKLTAITVALCLSVFCMALVSLSSIIPGPGSVALLYDRQQEHPN